MVKISIKKEEKTIKPRQKQKQKQSQKVVVNIGGDLMKPKRRRAPRQTLQKNKVVNKQSTPTQINVPQALPIQQQPQQPPFNELIKYLRESEKQKEIIKEKDQKINELEKDKKEKERSKILTPDEVQDSFSTVYNNSNISSLTNSGSATPFFSRSVDPQELYDLLRKEADLRGENPNSGNISVATLQSNTPSISSSKSQNTLTTLATNNTNQSNLSSFFDRSNRNEDLTTYMTQSPPKEPTETKMKTKYDELLEVEIEAQQVAPPELVPADEDPVIDEVLKEEPENKIVVYGPQRATAQTATATQQMIGMDDSSIPTFLRPINAPSPAIHFKDVIGLKPTIAETKNIRQIRVNKFDINKPQSTQNEAKKSLLAIEPQSTQDEAKDTIKILENILKKEEEKKPLFVSPKKKEESVKGVGAFIQGSPIKSKQPSKLSDILKKTPTKPQSAAAAEPESEVVGSSVEGYDDFQKYITDKELKQKYKITNGKLGEMLIKNNITDPTTGKVFVIDPSNRVHVKGNTNSLKYQQLVELLLTNYKPGLIYKNI